MKILKIRWWEFWKWKAQAQILQELVSDSKSLHCRDLDELNDIKLENYQLKVNTIKFENQEKEIEHLKHMLTPRRDFPVCRSKKS